jgi:UDP-N-acetylmuramoyl-L-alanyl-D-glutamate--2,6-diaminopimelate ligase
MVDLGYEYLVLETTSHGLYQYRTWGVNPTLAGVTNIDNEHLDYHLTYDNYVEAKALLFRHAKIAVINADDRSYGKLNRLLKPTRTRVIEYSREFPLPSVINKAAKERFSEKYNLMNVRLVTALAQQVGISNQDIAAGVASFPGIPGRMEYIPNDRKLDIVVDFAHTSQGIKAALTALRSRMAGHKKKGRLISVNGCAGLRDVAKRPVMGATAAEIADLAIFTAEDPRVENVWSIINQMKANLGDNYDKVVSIADRKEAITFALQQARPGDTVVILGKGHEQSMCFGTTEYPWSDQQAVRDILPTLSAYSTKKS